MKAHFIQIKDQIQVLKNTSGVYFWKDKLDCIIYIGKANDLQKRLLSYLKEISALDIKTKKLQEEISSVDWIITNSQTEALLLEANMIKKHKPKYNIRLKDDKKYPYICVSTSEDYPRVFITRNINQKSNLYFGPYSDGKNTRFLLDLVHKIFPIRKKNLKLPLKTKQRPCLNFYMKRCLAPCQGNIDKQEYNEIVLQVIQFLKGKKEELKKYLEEKMLCYSEEMNFDKAIFYRDILEKVEQMRSKQTVYDILEKELDVIAFYTKDGQTEAALMEIREKHLESKKTFSLVQTQNCNNEQIAYAFMRDYYLNLKYIPSKIVLNYSLGNEEEKFLNFFKETFNQTPQIIIPQRGQKFQLIKIAEKNAEKSLLEKIISEKIRDKTYILKEIKTLLNLKQIPIHIECFDISHFHAKQPFGSCVVFKNGIASKKDYRIFGIKHYKEVNDPGMIHETVARRLQSLLNENLNLPQLIIIDGGITQLNRAFEIIQNLSLEDKVEIISIAKKREEIYFPNKNKPYSFDKNLPALKLIRQIRDESHRFAIKHHRKKRDKVLFDSIFEEIPNVGKEKKKQILNLLKNFENVKNLTQKDLMSINGIGIKLSLKILDKLQNYDV